MIDEEGICRFGVLSLQMMEVKEMIVNTRCCTSTVEVQMKREESGVVGECKLPSSFFVRCLYRPYNQPMVR